MFLKNMAAKGLGGAVVSSALNFRVQPVAALADQPGAGGERRRPALGATGRMRQLRSFSRPSGTAALRKHLPFTRPATVGFGLRRHGGWCESQKF